MKKIIFVTTNTCKGAESCLVNRYAAFLLPFHIISIPETVSLLNVNGSQSVWPFNGCWSHWCQRHLFVLAYHEDKYIYKPHNDQQMRPTNNGLPTGESQLPNAELRQLVKGYLSDIGGLESLKEDVFQLMESLVASMEILGLDSGAALHYFFVCRCTVDLITDLECLLLQSSNSSQSCSN